MDNAVTVGIAGHVRPDGDCVGSCMGLYLYLKKAYPGKQISVFLENVIDNYRFLNSWEESKKNCEEDSFDLFFALDCGEVSRIGVAGDAFLNSRTRVNIDHHISNTQFGDHNEVYPDSSSASEVIYELINYDGGEPDQSIAEALYTGIVQDTGVFQYTCTGKRTMEIAGILMNYGIPYSKIIEETFFLKSFGQNRILGEALVRSRIIQDGQVIVSYLDQEDMKEYGVTSSDLDGIVSQLRNTKNVEVSVFLYELTEGEYKVSLRSKEIVDVAAVAAAFGGGGHKRASGCSLKGEPETIIEQVTEEIRRQLIELN